MTVGDDEQPQNAASTDSVETSTTSDGLRRRRGNNDEDDVEQQKPNNDKQVVPTTTPEAVEEPKKEGAMVKGHSDELVKKRDDLDSTRDHVETVERGLGGDSYSLLFVYGSPFKATFLFAMGVFAFQVVVFSTFLADITDVGSNNPFRIPPGCSTTVRVMQTFALLIALLNNGEIVSTISQFNEGYHNLQFKNLPPHASHSKWILMCVTHFAEGILALVVNFILIMQSTEAKPLFLSLSATAIISKVDDLTFAVASAGYVSKALVTRTEQVSKIKITSSKLKKKTRIVFFLTYILLLAGWGVIAAQQRQGKYIASTISVAFGIYSFLGYRFEHFSGAYDVEEGSLGQNMRAVYLERRFNENTSLGRGKFSYCEEEQAWVFTIEPTNSSTELPRSGKDCAWLLRSPKTSSYAVTDFPTSSSWTKWIGRNEPTTFFRLNNADCYSRRDCFGRGECGDNRDCICDEGWYGLRCEYEAPCTAITSLAASDITVDDQPAFSPSYNQSFLPGATMYGLPVYAYEHPADAYTVDVRQIDFIYFTGRRWFATKKWVLAKDMANPDAFLIEYFRNYHAQWQKYFTPILASEQTTAGTPTELNWYRYRTDDEEVPITADGPGVIFTCSECTMADGIVVDSCTFGECQKHVDGSKQCECVQGRSGPSCDVPPTAGADLVQVMAAVTFDDGSPSCRSCIYNHAHFIGDCHSRPITDPITIDGVKVRFAIRYDGNDLKIYSITDDVMLQHVDVADGLFQVIDQTSKTDYYLYQRELCDENIATLVGTLNLDLDERALAIEVDEAGATSILAIEASEIQEDGTILVNENPLCDDMSQYTAGVCYLPGQVELLQTNTRKAWLTLQVLS